MRPVPPTRSSWRAWLVPHRRLRRLDPEVHAPPRKSSRRRWMRLGVLTAALAAIAAGIAFWPRPKTLDRGPGQTLADFQLRDVRTGETVSLSQFRDRAEAVVMTFTGVDCPLGNLYVPRLIEFSRRYKDRGVVFLAINSNEHEPADEVASHAEQYKIPYPVLKDPNNRVADLYLAERTCETLVVDGSLNLRYRGAIDDQYALRTRRDAPRREFLVEALDAILAGRKVPVSTTQVVGCPIERIDPRAPARIAPVAPEIQAVLDQNEPEVEVGEVTYAADVAPILHEKCAGCHRPGHVAPFSLLSFDDAERWATSIWEVVQDRRMPPWQADPRYGHFANDRSLSPRQRAVLIAWVEQGSPAGDLSKAPAPPEFPTGWTIGTPDVVFEMPETFQVQAEGTLPFQHFRVHTNFQQDMWVQAAEARPGDRAVVHHVFVYVDDHAEDSEGKALPKNYLTGYAPGDMPSVFPDGVAKKVPAGADLTFEVHYTPIGQIRYDRCSVGLVFATKPPDHEAITKGISQRRLWIPPGVKNHPERSSWTFPQDAHLLSLTPHMHLRGVDFIYTATYPDGRQETLLSVPRYDFNWQSVYRLVEPKSMPRGTRIDCLAHYDNSPGNHANPDPTASVHWGEQTWDEMMIGYIDYYLDGPIDLSAPPSRGD